MAGNRTSLVQHLPREIVEEACNYLPPSVASQFTQNCLFLFPSLSQRYADRARAQVEKLLLHVAQGKFVEAEAMIKADPGLLLETGTVVDYSGRLIEGTALRIALGAGDVSLDTPCDLISVSTLPASGNLASIMITKKTAYVRYGDQLFYIDKANNNECTEIRLDKDELKHKAALKQFDAEMHPRTAARRLTEDELKRITALTGHIHEEGMAEMIERHLRQLPNGEAIIAAQKREQFPDGWEKREEERAARDLIALNEVVQAIADSKDHDDSNAKTAIEKFLAYLQPQGVIKTGMHVNSQLLAKAFRLYDDNYDRFGGWDTPKNNVFWREIIGGIQCFATACDAMGLCQGPYFIVEEGEKLKRSLQFRYSDNGANTYFYPLGLNPHFRLGKEYAGAGARRLRAGGAACGRGGRWVGLRLYETLSSKKHQRCESLCNVPTRKRKAGMS